MNTYIYQADLYCEGCAEKIKNKLTYNPYADISGSFDSNDYPLGPYPNGGGEADTPQHCVSCGLFLENPLTEDGELYVQTTVDIWVQDKHGDREVIQAWLNYYDYLDLTLENF